jgi:hypothetical protein
MERFLVSAVVTVLLIRTYLALTGYPQIGGHGLHIAHMLFGGLGMLVALLASLTFLGPGVRLFGAMVGGAGFGAFIDELGKFITSDNDYFYQPTVALIYIVFVLLYLAGERLGNELNPTPEARLAQASDVVTGMVVNDYPETERELALRLLEQSDQTNPLVPALRDAVSRLDARPDPRPGFTIAMSRRVAAAYAWLVDQGWFLQVVMAIAAATAVFSLRELSESLFAEQGPGRVRAYLESTTGLLLITNLVAGLLLIIGLMQLGRSRLSAYRWFRRAVLISLLVAQPLAFYAQQWTALIGLALNLVLLSAIDYAIARELAAEGRSDHAQMNHGLS